ncbi:glycosyltransferase family A protein [Luteimonas sp. 22616]|uniref:glycosyltransferase family A protein n=1 Tax=Luteimonas sp. 22616 TaxID=3453951 RepID=UPI003F83EF34
MFDPANHCFVVPAYGESPHLAECLDSLAAQSTKSRVLVTTSTPNRHITDLARRHGIHVHVNLQQGGGIGADWNFALAQAHGEWVTLAHQDDIYYPDFGSEVRLALSRNPDAVLAFSGYGEIEGSSPRPASLLLLIKKFLLELGFLGRSRTASRFSKINALRFGCAIPCPAVTMKSDSFRFDTELKVDLDWAAWLELARTPGAFVYIRQSLMQHRVHPESETSTAISTGVRLAEDEAILKSLWPSFIARAILASYRIAYRSNDAPGKP